MHAVIPAAGVGRRLFGDDGTQMPKSLIRFAGESLLARHLRILRACGVTRVTLVVGYRAADVALEAGQNAPAGFVGTVENPRFREGSALSLWTAKAALESGDDILFLDADTLYPPELIQRLMAADAADCLLFDSALDGDEDPVRLCLQGGRPVDFGKMIEGEFDRVGEWPGFMKLSPSGAARLVAALETVVTEGTGDEPYEDAIAVLVREGGWFGIEDISDLPWVEIDFPDDLKRARAEILPLVNSAPDDASGC